jgi:hypothetical protein
MRNTTMRESHKSNPFRSSADYFPVRTLPDGNLVMGEGSHVF